MRRPLRQLQEGATGALQILIGEAGARALPGAVGLNQGGNVGLAIQALAALVLGGVADRTLGSKAGTFVLAGGLSAPIKTLIVANNVPVLSGLLSPAAAGGDVSGYMMGRYPQVASPRLAAYSRGQGGLPGMGAYHGNDDFDYYTA